MLRSSAIVFKSVLPCYGRGADKGLHPWVITSPLGVKFTLGAKFTLGPSWPLGPSSPLETNFTPGDQLHPWRPTSPLGANFTHAGQNSPLVAKFKIGLRADLHAMGPSKFEGTLSSRMGASISASSLAWMYARCKRGSQYYIRSPNLQL
jgi:hypothetical protein